MKIAKYTFYSLCIGVVQFLFAQDASKLSCDRNIEEGDKLYKIGSYYNALYYYRNALSKVDVDKEKEKHHDIVWKVGECYFLLRDYERAAYYLVEIRKNTEKFPFANLYFAKSLKYQGLYDSSSIALRETIKFAQGDYVGEIKNQASIDLKGNELAKALLKDTNNIKIKRLPDDINGYSSDFAPKLWNEKLIYSHITTTVENENYGEKIRNDEAVANIFVTTQSQYGWAPGKPIENTINSKDTNTCNGVFNAQKSKFYFTKCEITKTLGTRCDIYVADVWKSEFNNIHKLDINDNNATNTQPFIAHINNNDILFFVSNREGSKGGLDVWYSFVRSENNYTQPRNCKQINTVYNETTPFYDSDTKEFYFSSDGLPGFGGLDVYRTTYDNEKFGVPYNIGFPINSALDDHYFITYDKGNKGFLVSNRNVKGTKRKTFDDDIFEVQILKTEAQLKQENELAIAKLKEQKQMQEEETRLKQQELSSKPNEVASSKPDKSKKKESKVEHNTISIPEETKPKRSKIEPFASNEKTSYCVQVAAVKDFSAMRKFQSLLSNYDVYYEATNTGMYRILVGNYLDRSTAEKIQHELKTNGYPQAIIGIYENGTKVK